MSIKITYHCNICSDTKLKEEIKALIFAAGGKKFSLWDWNTHAFMEHKGVHVCNQCIDNFEELLCR